MDFDQIAPPGLYHWTLLKTSFPDPRLCPFGKFLDPLLRTLLKHSPRPVWKAVPRIFTVKPPQLVGEMTALAITVFTAALIRRKHSSEASERQSVVSEFIACVYLYYLVITRAGENTEAELQDYYVIQGCHAIADPVGSPSASRELSPLYTMYHKVGLYAWHFLQFTQVLTALLKQTFSTHRGWFGV